VGCPHTVSAYYVVIMLNMISILIEYSMLIII